MQTWTHKKLVDKLLKSKVNYCLSGGIDENEFIKTERYTDELTRRLQISDDERRKIYKNGYDQGKFDEAAEREFEIDRHSHERVITSSPYLSQEKLTGKISN